MPSVIGNTSSHANKLLVRNVPSEVRSWITDETGRQKITQNELLLATLKTAATGLSEPTLFDSVTPVPPASDTAFFSFVDLFAGIGGFRLGLERAGGYCRMSAEWDKHSQKTYKHWFGEVPLGDVTKIKPDEIPDHDVLAAGFPCQPFSIAGVSKKNSLGREHGFKCATQGTLFFNLASIIEIKRPPVVMLENVRNLISHDKGQTWKVIRGTLEDLNYTVFADVIDAADYVPQHRERVFIVAFDQRVFGKTIDFEFPTPPDATPKLRDILDPNPPAHYTLTDHLWNYLQAYAQRHKEKGNGFGFGLADLNGTTRTLSARYFKDGSEILIPQGAKKNPRRLTPQEAGRLMGFPDKLTSRIVVSDTQAYRQFGNAIVPPVAEAVAKAMIRAVTKALRSDGNGCLLKGRLVKAK